jgi:8-amino-7-oxononanoate synthase
MLGLKQLFVHINQYNQPSFRNENVTSIAQNFRKGFDVKAILSPTVPEGRNDFVLFAQF